MEFEYKVGDLLAGWRDGNLIIGYITDIIQAKYPGYYRVDWLPPNSDLDGLFPNEQVDKLRKLYEENYDK